jgi:hypothetical protein
LHTPTYRGVGGVKCSPPHLLKIALTPAYIIFPDFTFAHPQPFVHHVANFLRK